MKVAVPPLPKAFDPVKTLDDYLTTGPRVRQSLSSLAMRRILRWRSADVLTGWHA